MIKEKALESHRSGYSCSECIVQAGIDAGICDAALLPCATTFSGGMSSGCLCGAVAGAQMILGYIYGRNNRFGNTIPAREKAGEFIEEFKKRNKVTCCRILSAGYSGTDRKMHCAKFVSDACEILEEIIQVSKV